MIWHALCVVVSMGIACCLYARSLHLRLSCRLVFTSEPRIIALNTVDGTARWTADEFPASTSFDFRGAFVDPPPVVDARSERVYFAESYPVRMRGYSTNNGQVLVRS